MGESVEICSYNALEKSSRGRIQNYMRQCPWIGRVLENVLIIAGRKGEYMHQNIVRHIWCGCIWKFSSGCFYVLSETGNN